jgi:predicted PurR-regulated permease PerM
VRAVTGLVAAVFLWSLGVDFPILWGLLAVLLCYVPTIGSIIAAIPPVLLALIQLGPGAAGGVAIGFFAINLVMGNAIEPRFMGKGLGLSTLVVFLSLVLWGWILGPVGMLLSVPLTMTAKIALEANPNTAWLAHLLGPADALPSPGAAEAPDLGNVDDAAIEGRPS